MNYKILNTIGNTFTFEAKEILERIGSIEYCNIEQEQLKEKIVDVDIAVIGLGLTFDKEVLALANNLKVIATATTGLDHIDCEYAEEKGIQVLSLRDETSFLNTITGTAELTFGLMIDLMRGISSSFESVKEYHWDREQFRGFEAKGKNLGIVGFGRLGKMMAQYGKAFGMNVLVSDPNIDLSESEQARVSVVSFDDLVEKSDVISIHVHFNEDTKDMFHSDVFKKMKRSAYIINTSRGKIVNESDLLFALQEKEIAGYGSDVLADELEFSSGFSNHPLVEYAKINTNCIILPHIGGMTEESRAATDIFIAKKLKKFILSS